MVNFGLGPLGMAPTTLPEISNPAIPENILIGKEALNGAEDLIVGTMENNGAIEENIELVDQVVEIPLGFHNGEGFVQIAASEQAKIIPENIKAGVTILGVDGEASVVDTADATASAEEILKDKVAYVNGVKVTGTYVKPILHKPTISIEDGILTITPNADNGIYAEGYKIYVDGTLLVTTSETEIEPGLLLDEPGTYAITVATYGTSFIDSPETEAVEFVLAE